MKHGPRTPFLSVPEKRKKKKMKKKILNQYSTLKQPHSTTKDIYETRLLELLSERSRNGGIKCFEARGVY